MDEQTPDTTLSLDATVLTAQAEALPDPALAHSAAPHYALLDTLGRGAMGEIWRAQDLGLKRQVAYKRMHGHVARQTSALSRFLREMQITAQLDHPHIVPVYECELTPEGGLAYTMKLVHGQTLKALLQQKQQVLDAGQPLPPELSLERLIELFLSVCDALAYAHSKGVIHRDLKPVNLMIGAYGEIYVMDWGIARCMGTPDEPLVLGDEAVQVDSPQSLDETQVGQILGTPRYMSPQQAAGKNDVLDGRSDEFSLGLILFELLTLRPAFQATEPIALIKQVLKVELAPFVPYHAQAPIPRELEAIVRKATARKPEDRYAGVAEMAADVRRWQQGQAVMAQRDSFLQALARWTSHHRQLTLGIGLGVLLLGLLGVGSSLWNQQQALARAQAHEARLNDLFGQVSQQAQRIDAHFLRMQGLLNYLTAAAEQYLAQGAPSQEPIYPQDPFLPPDLVESPLFGGKISLNWPTSGFSPNKGPEDMNGKLQRLLPLRHTLREVVLRSQTETPEQLSEAEVEKLIAHTGAPIMWAHVSLEEGVIYMYPGMGFTTPGYDAPTRPFYLMGARKQGLVWGAPYFDPLSGALLPCLRSLYDPQGRFVGVAVIDLRVEYLITHFMAMKGLPNLRQSWLLDAQGRIIIHSNSHNPAAPDSTTRKFETPAFPDDRLQAAVRQRDSGGVLQDRQRILSYSRLDTLGWYFVAELPVEAPDE
ncbi:MAG: serine/threonine protein kinase [Candidatus Sericytochromatia bacterium]